MSTSLRSLAGLLITATFVAACADSITQPNLPALVADGSVASNAGKPAGQGANACHKLSDALSTVFEIPVAVNAKYNVGNPKEVLIAGDCDGGPILFVDDGMTISLSNPTGGGGSIHLNFYDFCGGSNTGGPAVDVTSFFKPGTNSFTLTITNDCGGFVFGPPLYLVVRQK